MEDRTREFLFSAHGKRRGSSGRNGRGARDRSLPARRRGHGAQRRLISADPGTLLSEYRTQIVLSTQFLSQSFEVSVNCGGVSHDETGDKAEERIVDFAVFSDSQRAAGRSGRDLIGPGPAKGKLRVGDAGYQPARR